MAVICVIFLFMQKYNNKNSMFKINLSNDMWVILRPIIRPKKNVTYYQKPKGRHLNQCQSCIEIK
jgi:hypothetical protein